MANTSESEKLIIANQKLGLQNKDKRSVELAIAKNETRFRFLIEKSTEMITLSSKEGKIVYGSPSIEKILGYTAEEYINKYPHNIIHPNDLNEYLEKKKKILQEPSGSFHFEHRRLHKNGSWIWCEGIVTNYLNEPKLNRLVSNFSDISERKKVEEEIKKTEQHLLSIYNSVADIIFVLEVEPNERYRFSSVNKSFQATTGIPYDMVVDKYVDEILPRASLNFVLGKYKEAIEKKQIIRWEETSQYPMGKLIGEVNVAPVFDESGNCIRLIGGVHDITKREKAEQKLRKSEAFNLGVLNSLSSHIAVIDDFGNIIAVNEAWRQFAMENGKTTLERTGVGMNYFKVCRKSIESGNEVASDALKGIMDVLQGKEDNFYLEYPCHSPDQQRWFGMNVKRFENDEAMVVIAHLNITALKLAENKLIVTFNELQCALGDITKIMDSSLDVICAVDAKGNFLKVSAASEAVWGYKPEELIGKPLINFVYHEDSDKTQVRAANVMTGNRFYHFENRYVRKDGSLVPIEWSARWDKKDQIRYGVARDVTEKKRLEKAFDIERQQFFDLFSKAPSSMGVLSGPDHRFEIANPLYLQLIGKKDIIGKSVKDVLPEVGEQGFIEILDRVYQTGKTYYANEMLIKLDVNNNGKPVDRFLNFMYQPHIGRDGKTDGILFFVVDVSEQVLSRKKIEESEARLNEAQAIAKMGNWETDLETLKVIWSDETFRIFEIDPEDHQLFHTNFLEYVHPEDRAKADAAFKFSIKNTSINVIEHRIVTPSLEVKIIEERWKILKDNNGNPIRAVGTCQDITERKQIKEKLELTQFTFDSASDAIFWMNPEAKIIDVNQAACVSLGYSRQELLSISVLDIYPIFNLDTWSGFFSELSKKHSISIETTHLKKDGSLFPVEIRATFIKFGDKEFSCVFARDITERKKAEQNLEHQNKELKKTNTELDRFVYSVSHDLRAPLASLLGLIEMTTDDINSSNELQRERMGMMKQSVLKLDNFIEDILDYSRNARTEFAKENIVFEDMIHEVLAKHKFMKGVNGFKLDVNVNQNAEFISDKRRINVILNNLISNAIKYKDATNEKSFVHISVQSDKKNATIIIEDNGIGIAEKDKTKIFEMFYRASAQSTGSGLGLYIVKETIEKLGAKINLVSEKSVGSKFTITITNLRNDENKNNTTD